MVVAFVARPWLSCCFVQPSLGTRSRLEHDFRGCTDTKSWGKHIEYSEAQLDDAIMYLYAQYESQENVSDS